MAAVTSGIELATAYVSLTVDASKIAPEIRKQFTGVESQADRTGKEAGSRFSRAFEAPLRLLKTTIVGTFTAAGVAGSAALTAAVSVDAANDKLAAQLGLSEKRSAQIGKVAGKLYADAYGESIGDVNTAVGSVVTSIEGMRRASGKAIRSTTAQALDFASAFEVDVQRAVQVAGGTISTGLAKNATEAFDLIVTASQRVPSSLREDLLDAVDEYGQFFSSLGYSGEAAFATLVKGSEKGMFGIDKAGDAVKEFTIRATDMSTASKDAYKLIGLDARTMADAILAGGDTAQSATQRILGGLLSLPAGAKQANAAIALFGTPLEDLGVRGIPKFLEGLQSGSKAMSGFRGNAEKMGTTLNDNAATNLESFKRQVTTTFVDFVGGKALPVLDKLASRFAQDVGPAIADALPKIAAAGTAFAQDVLPPIRELLPEVLAAGTAFVEFLLPALSKLVEIGGPVLEKLASVSESVFSKLSDGSTESKVALGGLAAVAAGYGAIKLGQGVADGIAEAKAKFDETKETLVGFKDGLLDARDQAVAFKDGVVEFGGTLKQIPGQISGGLTAIKTQAAAMVSGTKTAATYAAAQVRAAATATASAAKSAAAWVASTARTTAAMVAQGVVFVASRAAMIAGAAATAVVTAAQWALNAAMTANPIGIVVVAIAALVGGLILAYKKSETFKKIVDGAFRAVQKAASFAFNWVKKNWPLILAIITGPIGLAVLAVVKNWDKIKAGAAAAVDGTKAVLGRLVGFVTSIPGRITGGLGDLKDLLLDTGKNIIGGLIQGIRDMAGDLIDAIKESVTDKIPGFIKDAMGIASPSKVTKRLGGFIMAGLIEGIRGGESGLDKRLARVTKVLDRNLDRRLDEIAKQLKNKAISKAVAKDLEQAAKAHAKSMTSIVDQAGKELSKLARRYEKETGRLKQLIDARASMAASISSSVQGELDLGSLIAAPTETTNWAGEITRSPGGVTFDAIAGAVAGLAARAKRFAGRLRAMLKAGIPKGLVQEVASLGSIQGIQVANALLSGSTAQITSLAADYRDVATNANAVGDVIAGAFYDKSIKAQENLIAGLLKKPAIRKAARTFAGAFTDELLAALGVKVKDPAPKSTTGAARVSGSAAARTVPVPRLSVAETTGRSGASATLDDLFAALAKVRLDVTVGASNRTKGRWYMDGKKAAEGQD